MSGFRNNYGMSSNRNNHQGDERSYNNNNVPAFRRYFPHRQQHHHHHQHHNNNQYRYRHQHQYQYQYQQEQEEDFFTRQQKQHLEYILNRYSRPTHGQLEQQWREVQRQIQVRNAADFVGTSTQAQDAGTDDTEIVNIIDRFSQSVTPYVLVQCLSNHQAGMDGAKARERDVRPFFNLGYLWDCYEEWSVYGAGVPLTLSGNQAIVQYYVPSLSGIQLYIEDPSDTNSPWLLAFEHLEAERPYNRLPLFDQIGVLSAQCPMLMTLNSCDLMPTSWIAVAWYPIYMIPSGLTLKNVDACFLTLHCLSTKPAGAGNKEPQHGAGTSGSSSSTTTIPLPVFGIASYKLRGSSILKTGGDNEQQQQQQNCMMKAADTWLKARKVHLPDFSFFASRWR